MGDIEVASIETPTEALRHTSRKDAWDNASSSAHILAMVTSLSQTASVNNGTYSFDIADGRIRAIYVVRNPDKLRRFVEQTH